MSAKFTPIVKAQGEGRKLPPPGEPLILMDGSVHFPLRRPKEIALLLDIPPEPNKIKPVQIRTIKEMPAPPMAMNAIAVVFAYSIMGLADSDIAELMELIPDQIRAVRNSPAYAELFSTAMQTFINTNSDHLQSRIAAYAHAAASSVATIAINSRNERNRLTASQDILDRAGFRPSDMQDRRMSDDSDLTIVVMEEEKRIEKPMQFDVPDDGREFGQTNDKDQAGQERERDPSEFDPATESWGDRF